MAYTSLLGLLLPDTGSLSGTWGTAVNEQITALLDSAIAGTTYVTDDADVTLTSTQGVANQARQLILNCTGTRTGVRDITAPETSKAYIVINQTSSSIRIKTASSTVPLAIDAGNAALVVLPQGEVNFIAVTWASLADRTFSNATFTNGYTVETFSASTGSAYTVSFNGGSMFFLTLTASCTFTFPTPEAGKSFSLLLRQDATGSRTATWPATVRWPANTAPTLTSTATRGDRLDFISDGTYWYGEVVGQNYYA